MNKRSLGILTSISLGLILAFVFYHQTHLSVWGFNLSKNDIKDVIVLKENKSYLITDEDRVLMIANEISNMNKVEVTDSFPISTAEFTKILVRTKDNTTYGGSILIKGESIVQNSNGFYWNFNYKKLSNELNSALKTASILN
ncbi:hypothetical protein [Alkalihalobacillus sp. TS-13]|uniref:hypothetical protein n=1 Tax=Alkalihalobacillus sp. TS-13 TaxID=2842455 RepID=UPI001C88196E|nr:hypothetical protein [Alkalihalobacillus sp. TS-13]